LLGLQGILFGQRNSVQTSSLPVPPNPEFCIIAAEPEQARRARPTILARPDFFLGAESRDSYSIHADQNSRV
jgi:hypothetical protein